ncbi:DNA/RNA non-specific endonuclease [Spirosoma koreense]
MLTNSRPTNQKYHRRGFRLSGNTLILLLIFFLIGLFLQYGGRTKPVVSFWNDLRQVIGLGKARSNHKERNPYKAPEPQETEPSSDVATDDRAGKASDESEASDKAGKPSMNSAKTVRFDFEKQVDFLLPLVQSGDQIIRHEGYTLRYREEYKDADWVAYPLLDYETTGEAERKLEQFQPDLSVPNGTALSSDYTRSGFDRGHLAPAADFKFSQRMMRETFYMSNITPQVPQFNRGIWKDLEDLVRRWAVRDNGLYVVTGAVLKPGLPTIGRSNEISVPEKFYKVILYCNNPEIRMIGFLLNNEPSDRSLKQFVVSVDTIEQLTGIDFFPKLPDDLERKLESKSRSEMTAEWFSY